MTKLIVFIASFLTILGCSSRKKLVEKTLIGATVERVVEVKEKSVEAKVADSVAVKKNVVQHKEQDVKLKVEFDPKINDSLEVRQVIGTDTLNLKISGNGKVTLDFTSKKSEDKKETSELFGSKTLKNIEKAVVQKEKEEIKIDSTVKKKDNSSKGMQFSIYIVGGAIILAGFGLYLLSRKFPKMQFWKNKKQ